MGRFADAARDYEAAYMLHADAALLYNAAQAYRLSGDSSKALVLYRNYVHLYPSERNIDEVRAQIAACKRPS